MNLFKILNKKNNLSDETIHYLKHKYPRFVVDGKKRNEWKNYLVILLTTQTACSNCKELAKHVYIDDIFSNGKSKSRYELLSKAVAKGALMDNCHVSVHTYFEGISTPPSQRNNTNI